MPVVSGDIKYYTSTQSGSLGGAITVTEVTPSTIFDTVNSTEASSGDTEYRCIYVKNTNGSIALQSAVLWIVTDANPGDIAIALGGEGKNGTAETVANENTAPVGESFTSPASKGAGLSLGTLNAGDTYPIWVRRTIPASTGAANDSFTIRVEGDTGP
jgi:hypothetical protein